uniref:Uncharacterized protein n=1 Tax=Rhizophora mucronata TaxID=61149 RepID=A0A2P2QEJ5_RHIMU
METAWAKVLGKKDSYVAFTKRKS